MHIFWKEYIKLFETLMSYEYLFIYEESRIIIKNKYNK